MCSTLFSVYPFLSSLTPSLLPYGDLGKCSPKASPPQVLLPFGALIYLLSLNRHLALWQHRLASQLGHRWRLLWFWRFSLQKGIWVFLPQSCPVLLHPVLTVVQCRFFKTFRNFNFVSHCPRKSSCSSSTNLHFFTESTACACVTVARTVCKCCVLVRNQMLDTGTSCLTIPVWI